MSFSLCFIWWQQLSPEYFFVAVEVYYFWRPPKSPYKVIKEEYFPDKMIGKPLTINIKILTLNYFPTAEPAYQSELVSLWRSPAF